LTLQTFNNAIGGNGIHHQSFSQPVGALVMSAVYFSLPSASNLFQKTLPFDVDSMVTVCTVDLGVVGLPRGKDVGNERSAQEYVGHLQAPADAQDRQLILL